MFGRCISDGGTTGEFVYMREKREKIIDAVIVVLSVILGICFVILLYRHDQAERKEVPSKPVEEEEKRGVYKTEDHSEFADDYKAMGASDDLVALNEEIVVDGLEEGEWSVVVDGEEYTLTFEDGTFTAEGEGTTTSGVYTMSYRSDAPQYIYLELESEYVNIAGFVGYSDGWIYVYTNVEDEEQTPPVSEYWILRREVNG